MAWQEVAYILEKSASRIFPQLCGIKLSRHKSFGRDLHSHKLITGTPTKALLLDILGWESKVADKVGVERKQVLSWKLSSIEVLQTLHTLACGSRIPRFKNWYVYPRPVARLLGEDGAGRPHDRDNETRSLQILDDQFETEQKKLCEAGLLTPEELQKLRDVRDRKVAKCMAKETKEVVLQPARKTELAKIDSPEEKTRQDRGSGEEKVRVENVEGQAIKKVKKGVEQTEI